MAGDEDSSRMHMMAQVRPGTGLCSDKPKLKGIAGAGREECSKPWAPDMLHGSWHDGGVCDSTESLEADWSAENASATYMEMEHGSWNGSLECTDSLGYSH